MSCKTIQRPDNSYDTSLDRPTFSDEAPNVLYDEAHLNTHSASGTYKPFIDLIKNDGYEVTVNQKLFSTDELSSYDLLIICNAKSDKNLPRDVGAFSEEEIKSVNQWVVEGGSLLLIADHHPFGLANRSLAKSFGVEMGCGSVKDYSVEGQKNKGVLEFKPSNGLLIGHPITEGYKAGEKLNQVFTFTGQSLRGGADSVALLKFDSNAMEVRPDSIWVEHGKNFISYSKPIPVPGLSQAVALEFEKGRVVILGEAAMMTAQKLFGKKFGMNAPKDSDNRQFALNVMHWLSDRLD